MGAWGLGSRRALERLLVERKPTLGRAKVPAELQDCLKQFASPALPVPDKETVSPTLNAVVRLLGQARKQKRPQSDYKPRAARQSSVAATSSMATSELSCGA